MLSIYADNFRGFTKTTINFTRVNFLVGENSTGKTSILSLFSLLHDHTFWFSHEFNTEVVSLGYFNEISSSSSDDRFTIGFGDTELQTPISDKPQRRYYLLEFCNRLASALVSVNRFLWRKDARANSHGMENKKWGKGVWRLCLNI
jgi:predicted ATP-dependent endonuclease of OLD family